MRLLLLPALLLLNLACRTETQSFHSVDIDPDISIASSFADIPDEIHGIGDELHVGDSLLTPEPEPANPTVHLDTAHVYVGVKEDPKDSNRGTEVEMFLASVGLKPFLRPNGEWKSFPWCAAFVSFCLENAEGLWLPMIRSAGARKFITNESIRANVVQRGTVHIEAGTLVIWKAKRDPEDVSGHIGFVIEWNGQEGTTLEGNTGPGEEGDQRDGGGVYIRKRLLSPGSAFRITDFTPVTPHVGDS